MYQAKPPKYFTENCLSLKFLGSHFPSAAQVVSWGRVVALPASELVKSAARRMGARSNMR